MACVEDMNKEVILSGTSFKECRVYVESHYSEVHFVEPGYRMFDKYIIGVPPIAIGIDGENIIFPIYQALLRYIPPENCMSGRD